MPNTPTYKLAFTVLPNGFSDAGHLRLSVVLTPSITPGQDNKNPPNDLPVSIKGSPFENWTKKLNDMGRFDLSFVFQPIQSGGPTINVNPVRISTGSLVPEMWAHLFGDDRKAQRRTGNSSLREAWRLSHNISHVHRRHTRLRHAHAQRTLNSQIANGADDGTVEVLRSLHTAYNEDVNANSAPSLYIHPTQAMDNSDVSQQLDERAAALTKIATILAGAGVDPRIATRAAHALDRLETKEGARLQAVPLYCVYRHCVQSVAPAGVDLSGAVPTPNPNATLFSIYQQLTDAAAALIPIFSLSVAPASSRAGESVTLTAKLSSAYTDLAAATRQVTFHANNASIAVATLQANHQAAVTLSTLPEGLTTLSVTYPSGDANLPAGRSLNLTYAVGAAGASTVATPTGPSRVSASADPPADAVDDLQHYIETLLFYRRDPGDAKCKPIPEADFHQLLGMVNHYPALLRPLGLVFDVEIPIPDLITDGKYAISVNTPEEAGTVGIFASIPKANMRPLVTACMFNRGGQLFYTASRDESVMDNGYLALTSQRKGKQGSTYSFVQDDADGTALKFIEQAGNAARSSEYGSAAPTSLSIQTGANRFRDPKHPGIVPTPASTANPVDAPPAARTVGLALFHEGRLSTLEGIASNNATTIDADNAPPLTLCAEDVMLGFRVDIKYNNRSWRQLCARNSRYEIGTAPAMYWPPSGTLQNDEGFIGQAATQSSGGDSGQTQVHQSLVTWTGWSLALPKPESFKTVNPTANRDGSGPLRIKAIFTRPDHLLLPPLRFNGAYKVRCRVVDLAGNGPAFSETDGPFFMELDPLFSRHEPIRAPQLLLTEPIDRDDSPGEHFDRLVARDGEETSPRMLVPPRESLRMAELHNMVNMKDPLPESAFTTQFLMPDGSFPSVYEAARQGWIQKDIPSSEKTHYQDAFFRERKGFESRVLNPFYPDPLAHYIRVRPFLVSDDPTLSRPLGEPFYIEIDPHDSWPNYLATIVDLNASPETNKPTVDYSNDDRPPSITVNLPRGYTVVLVVSSAAHDDSEPKKAGVPAILLR
jgi:hypothetical protein